MIAPRALLIFLSACFLLPAATILVAMPALAPLAAMVLSLLILIAAIDALLLQPDLSSLQILLPEVVRLSKDREGQIEVKCVNENEKIAQFRVGFPFPLEIGASLNELEADGTQGAAARLFLIPCRPTRRGRFVLRRCYVRAPTRLRLWSIRRTLPLKSELRVYPDLLAERRHVSALFLRRGMLGFRQYRQVGKGREFEKLRDYIAGDSVEDVHWKATAKRGRPVTKVFQIERTQEVYVIIDSSRLSARWSGGTPMLERFINSALILCLAAARQSDLFGLVTFSDKMQTFIRAKNGKAHYDVCRDALYTLQPRTVSPDFEELFTFLRLRLRRRALLVFFTALDDPIIAESFVQHVNLLTRQHLVLVNMIQPAEARALFTTDDVGQVDDIYRRLGGHLLWAELQEIRTRLHRVGVEFSLLSAEEIVAEAVSHYFRVKQRQIL